MVSAFVASLVGRDTSAFTVHVPPAVAGNGTRATWTGVSCMVAPEVAAVVPVLSLQLAFQLTVASPLVRALTPTVTEVGEFIVSVQVAVAPVPWQKPATFALAASTPAVIPPSVSRPIAAAQATRRRGLCIINCLSDRLAPMRPLMGRVSIGTCLHQ